MARLAMVEPAERQHEPGEDPPLTAAVHPGGFQHFPRNLGEVVAQEEDRERQSVGDVEEDDARDRPEQAHRAEEFGHGQQPDLHGYHEEPDDHEEDAVPAGEFQPREGVSGECRDGDHQDGGGHGDQDGVPEGRPDAGILQQGAVVVQGQLGRIGERGPPAFGRVVLLGAHGGQEQARQRRDPHEGDQDQGALDDGAAQQARELLPRRRPGADPGADGDGDGTGRTAVVRRDGLRRSAVL